ncbi:MAG: GNAT family N-acetyltransferase, partial [Micromonosporaceae bacterium]|nr:GNAT family N-acetyltransferase [Micromonosporaceae bacterium]
MESLTTRPYREADAAAVAALYNAVDEAAGGYAAVTAELVESFVAATVRAPAHDTRMVVAPDGELVGMAMVPTPPPGGFRVDLWGAVHPAWQGRGLGRELLGWQLARAATIHDASAPDASWEVQADTLVADEAAQRLYRRLGMVPARYWFEMEAATASAPSLPVPDGFQMVGYRSTLDKEVYDAHMEAFGDHWGFQRDEFDRWTEMSVGSQLFLPGLSLIALADGQIAGYVLCYREAEPGRLYVGQVGVRRPWRRRGLAAALLVEVLHRAARAG